MGKRDNERNNGILLRPLLCDTRKMSRSHLLRKNLKGTRSLKEEIRNEV